MDFEWVAIALGDVSWITLAFVLGFLVKLINLPPLVGFLATGFVLNYLGFTSGEPLQKLAAAVIHGWFKAQPESSHQTPGLVSDPVTYFSHSHYLWLGYLCAGLDECTTILRTRSQTGRHACLCTEFFQYGFCRQTSGRSR